MFETEVTGNTFKVNVRTFTKTMMDREAEKKNLRDWAPAVGSAFEVKAFEMKERR